MPIMCLWGRGLGYEVNKELEPCPRPVTNKVRLTSDSGASVDVDVCELHYVRLLRETDPD